MEPTQGSNVLGKAGGPADITLESNSLSRRHALIVVGTRAEQCTVEDLGSTNKSHIMAEDTGGDAQTLEPGMVYPLRACVQLVFGDVRAEFEFMRGPHTAATASSGGEGSRVDVETIKTGASRSSRGARSALAEHSLQASDQ